MNSAQRVSKRILGVFRFVFFYWSILSLIAMVTSLTLRQACDCRSTRDTTLKNIRSITSMALCKTAVTTVLTHWSYCSLALSVRRALAISNDIMMMSSNGNIFRVAGHLWGNSPVPGKFPHKGQWRGALKFSLICVWINGWVNNCEAGGLRRYRTHYDVIVM